MKKNPHDLQAPGWAGRMRSPGRNAMRTKKKDPHADLKKIIFRGRPSAKSATIGVSLFTAKKDPHAVALGRKGGKVTSPAKTKAARENAKRPRKREAAQ